MGVLGGRNIGDPGIGLRVDDAQNRAARHVAGGQIVAAIPRIVPYLVRSADSCDRLHALAGFHVQDERNGWEAGRNSVAADEQLLLWTKGEPGRLATSDRDELGDLQALRVDLGD